MNLDLDALETSFALVAPRGDQLIDTSSSTAPRQPSSRTPRKGSTA
jgi:hypothetical protein